MENDVDIVINGNEKGKSEIIYNSIVKNMKLTKDEQLDYLKTKINELETEIKNKNLFMSLFIIGIFGIIIGIFFLIFDFYWLGILIIIMVFLSIFFKFGLVYKNMLRINRTPNFEKIEHLREIIDLKLK